ncbi:hypothetical protein AB0N77_21590 [Streptomyces misionensis]|uniref:hypothetical protein n=1 Tax=Streptomyces misionensis TaxID=67331 RepID=UPI003435566A
MDAPLTAPSPPPAVAIPAEPERPAEAADLRATSQIAVQAAKQAVLAADAAMHAAARSTTASSRLDSIMIAAHQAAVEAERFARLAAEEEQAGNWATSRNFTARAVENAVKAQQTAGVPCTAQELTVLTERRRTQEELLEAERAEKERAAVYEAELRAETGMDAENRLRLEMAKYTARDEVPKLGWSRGMVGAMEIAQAGRLYRRDGFAWDSGRPSRFTGGRRVARDRVLMLARAGFLAVGRKDNRAITTTPMGDIALYLVRLHPDGVHADDRTAHAARLAANRKRGRRSDDIKAAARSLPPLDRYVLRSFKQPVTLAEQTARAAAEAEQTWESEGGALAPEPCKPRSPGRLWPLQLALDLGSLGEHSSTDRSPTAHAPSRRTACR